MLNFYSYSRIGTNENNMKTSMWTVLWTTIRKAGNHCQDVDHCQYHLAVRLETTVRIESNIRMKMSTQMIKTSGLP